MVSKRDVERKLTKEYGKIAATGQHVSMKLVGTALERLWGNRNQRRKESYRDFHYEISGLDGQALIDFFEEKAPKVLAGVSIRDAPSVVESSDDLRSSPTGQDADVEDAMRRQHPMQSAWRTNWGLRLSPPGEGAASNSPRPVTYGWGAGRKLESVGAKRKGEGKAGASAGKAAASRGKGEPMRNISAKPTQTRGNYPKEETNEPMLWEHGRLCREEWTVDIIQQDEVIGADSGVALVGRRYFEHYAYDVNTTGAIAVLLPGDKDFFRYKAMDPAVNARLDAAERVSFLLQHLGGQRAEAGSEGGSAGADGHN